MILVTNNGGPWTRLATSFSWYRYSNRDVMVLILALSMIAYVINGIGWSSNIFRSRVCKMALENNDLVDISLFLRGGFTLASLSSSTE